MPDVFSVAVLTPSTGLCRMAYAQSLARLCMYFAQVQVFEGQEHQNFVPDAIEGSGIASNYEQMVDKYLAKTDIRWTHFLSIEDDMAFAPECLHILARRKLPIVGANYSVNKGENLWFTARQNGDTLMTTDESTGVEEVDYLAQGFTLVAREVYEAIEKPWFMQGYSPVTKRHVSQDYLFCDKAREAGFKIYADHDVSKLIAHIGPHNYTYKDVAGRNGQLKCLDIGAGTVRRRWDGYRTYTLDVRAEVNPDFVSDSRKLEFPDNHWDMVASSHHLEHVGRFEQEQLWREMVRVLKPGGRMEHVVPNLEWAAARIAAGQMDDDVNNVLYGAQESHGYARELNTHYFGYTPAVAREMAASAGLTDVQVMTDKDQPELGYNLVVSGRKP